MCLHLCNVCVTQPEDMFVCDMEERNISCPPAWKKLKKSQCTPLFMNAYIMRGESFLLHSYTLPPILITVCSQSVIELISNPNAPNYPFLIKSVIYLFCLCQSPNQGLLLHKERNRKTEKLHLFKYDCFYFERLNGIRNVVYVFLNVVIMFTKGGKNHLVIQNDVTNSHGNEIVKSLIDAKYSPLVLFLLFSSYISQTFYSINVVYKITFLGKNSSEIKAETSVRLLFTKWSSCMGKLWFVEVLL